MARELNGEWPSPDPVAHAVHIMRVLTGVEAEIYEPPEDQRQPPDPAQGGRARAAKLTAEERSASAKKASGMTADDPRPLHRTRHRRLALLWTMVLAFGVAAGAAVPANAQPVSEVSLDNDSTLSDDGPTLHAYVTEFLREQSGCRNRVIPVLYTDDLDYWVYFEFRSGTGYSVLIWGADIATQDFGRLTYETSGVGSLAAIVQRVCNFVKTRQNQQ